MINILQIHITTIQIVPCDAYGTDAWNNILSNFTVWTQLTVLSTTYDSVHT